MTYDIKTDREIIAAATPGPWLADWGNGQVESRDSAHWRAPVLDRVDFSELLEHYEYSHLTAKPISPEANLEFAAESRTRWPAALDEIMRLETQLLLWKARAEAAEAALSLAKDDFDTRYP